MTAHEGVRYPCDICTDVLSSSQALKRHVRNVHEVKVKNFKCQFCGKSFKDKQTLQKHERIHDDSTKSDPCPECGKILSSNEVLRIHIRRVHERDFKGRRKQKWSGQLKTGVGGEGVKPSILIYCSCFPNIQQQKKRKKLQRNWLSAKWESFFLGGGQPFYVPFFYWVFP